MKIVRSFLLTAAVVALAAACSSNKNSDDDDDGGDSGNSGESTGAKGGSSSGSAGKGGTDSGSGGDGAGGNAGADTGGASPPKIISFSTNVHEINPDQSVTFSAVVTDPDGIDDLIGGTLKSENGKSTYGAFATSAAEGSYSITLSWDQIQQATPLPDESTEGDLTFVAEFYDTAAHSTSAEVVVHILCDVDNVGFTCCGGEAVNEVNNPDHCGACGNVCDSGFCYDSMCEI